MILAIFKVLISLVLGFLCMGIFLCFGGNDIENGNIFYFFFCLVIGIGMFVMGLYALFSV